MGTIASSSLLSWFISRNSLESLALRGKLRLEMIVEVVKKLLKVARKWE